MDEFDDILLDDYNIDEPNDQSAATQADDQGPTSDAPAMKKNMDKVKLNEFLLLDTKGIPLLRNETQYLKFKGKGHEDEDLKKLMTYYTVWANNLYPKLRFQDFAKRITKHTTGPRLKTMVKVWQDEFKERRQVRLDVRNELSGQTVGDEEDGTGDHREEEESSEDDNRPLFFPMTSTNAATTATKKPVKKSRPQPKQQPKKQQPLKRSKASAGSDDSEDEELLFSTSQKRKVVLDDDDDTRDNYTMDRSSALTLLAEKRRQRDLARKQEEERKMQEELEKKKAELEKPTDDLLLDYFGDDIQLAISDDELLQLNIPKPDEDPKEPVINNDDEDMGFSDKELIEEVIAPLVVSTETGSQIQLSEPNAEDET